MSGVSDQILEHLVIDSGAIIRGQGFGYHKVAKNFWTISEVLAEIRDEKSRDHLASLPFTLETKTPSEQAMKAVTDFAKKCGDYSQLSLTDLKLIALAYMLEVEEVGSSDHLRKEPIRHMPKAAPTKSATNTTSSSSSSAAQAPSVDAVGATLEQVHLAENAEDSTADTAAATSTAAEHGDDEENEDEGDEEYDDEDDEEYEDEDGDSSGGGLRWDGLPRRADEDDDAMAAVVNEPYELGDSDAFPSLGAPVCEEGDAEGVAAPAAAPVTTFNWAAKAAAAAPAGASSAAADSWTVVGSTSAAAAAGAKAKAKANGKQEVIQKVEPAADTKVSSAGASHFGEGSSSVNNNASGSRVIVSSAHSTSYSTVISAEKAEEEDDGEGWANPFNIQTLRANGQINSMVQINGASKGGKKKAAADATNAAPGATGSSAASVRGSGFFDAQPVTETEGAGNADLFAGISACDHEHEHGECGHDHSGDAAADDADAGEFVMKVNKKSKKYREAEAAASGAKPARTGGGRGKTNRNNRNSNASAVSAATLASPVGCVTSDFTMQNLMLQIGLKIISVADGMQIRSVTNYVLRCAACLTVHYDMSRLFCSRCGNAMLQRIACSINDNTGELRLHLKKNYHHNLQGTIYNLPKPLTQSRYSGEILLREDQLMAGIWRQKTNRVNKDVKSAFGVDVTSDVGIQLNKSEFKLTVGLGKNNPNRVKKTGNNKKKKNNSVK